MVNVVNKTEIARSYEIVIKKLARALKAQEGSISTRTELKALLDFLYAYVDSIKSFIFHDRSVFK